MSAERPLAAPRVNFGLQAERVAQARERIGEVEGMPADLADATASPAVERVVASEGLRSLLAAVGQELLGLSAALGKSTGQLREDARRRDRAGGADG